MKKDEWKLTQELGRLRKYGFLMQAERCDKDKPNDRYNIVLQNSREIIEPYCSIEEIIGIINVLEICFDKIKQYKRKPYD